MNKGRFFWIALAVVIGLIIIGVGVRWVLKDKANGSENERNNSTIENIGAGECAADSDCVPDSCCHAKECAAKGSGPDCSGIMCTQDCAPGTLDCGQGSCVCENKKCGAVFG